MKLPIREIIKGFKPVQFDTAEIIPALFIECFGEEPYDTLDEHTESMMSDVISVLVCGWTPTTESDCISVNEAFEWFNRHVLDLGYDPGTRYVLFENGMNKIIRLECEDPSADDENAIISRISGAFYHDEPDEIGIDVARFYAEGRVLADIKLSKIKEGTV